MSRPSLHDSRWHWTGLKPKKQDISARSILLINLATYVEYGGWNDIVRPAVVYLPQQDHGPGVLVHAYLGLGATALLQHGYYTRVGSGKVALVQQQFNHPQMPLPNVQYRHLLGCNFCFSQLTLAQRPNNAPAISTLPDLLQGALSTSQTVASSRIDSRHERWARWETYL